MIAPIELEKLEECRSLLEEIPLPRTCFPLSLTPQKKDPFPRGSTASKSESRFPR